MRVHRTARAEATDAEALGAVAESAEATGAEATGAEATGAGTVAAGTAARAFRVRYYPAGSYGYLDAMIPSILFSSFGLAMTSTLRALCLTLILGVLTLAPAQAQTEPRFGIGFQMLASTVEENVGPGIRFRVSAPVNRDLSISVGTSFTGYVFEGQDDATYAVDPTLSAIVTLPVVGTRGTYFLGGIGAYVPLGDNAASAAPFFHFGFGRVWLLRDTSVFFEVDPALVVSEEQADLLLPLRVGVIF
jgi:hypothetical protein